MTLIYIWIWEDTHEFNIILDLDPRPYLKVWYSLILPCGLSDGPDCKLKMKKKVWNFYFKKIHTFTWTVQLNYERSRSQTKNKKECVVFLLKKWPFVAQSDGLREIVREYYAFKYGRWFKSLPMRQKLDPWNYKYVSEDLLSSSSHQFNWTLPFPMLRVGDISSFGPWFMKPSLYKYHFPSDDYQFGISMLKLLGSGSRRVVNCGSPTSLIPFMDEEYDSTC